jgi:Neuraminidase (sialidase)
MACYYRSACVHVFAVYIEQYMTVTRLLTVWTTYSILFINTDSLEASNKVTELMFVQEDATIIYVMQCWFVRARVSRSRHDQQLSGRKLKSCIDSATDADTVSPRWPLVLSTLAIDKQSIGFKIYYSTDLGNTWAYIVNTSLLWNNYTALKLNKLENYVNLRDLSVKVLFEFQRSAVSS